MAWRVAWRGVAWRGVAWRGVARSLEGNVVVVVVVHYARAHVSTCLSSALSRVRVDT